MRAIASASGCLKVLPLVETRKWRQSGRARLQDVPVSVTGEEAALALEGPDEGDAAAVCGARVLALLRTGELRDVDLLAAKEVVVGRELAFLRERRQELLVGGVEQPCLLQLLLPPLRQREQLREGRGHEHELHAARQPVPGERPLIGAAHVDGLAIERLVPGQAALPDQRGQELALLGAEELVVLGGVGGRKVLSAVEPEVFDLERQSLRAEQLDEPLDVV